MEVEVGSDGSQWGYIIAVDAVGAGIGEEVLVSQGSSGRLALRNVNTPTDAVIVGIIDQKQGS
jgi:ethanolamine utilization protein EutN